MLYRLGATLCETNTVLEYIGDTIKRDMDETYQRIVERQFNNLLE